MHHYPLKLLLVNISKALPPTIEGIDHNSKPNLEFKPNWPVELDLTALLRFAQSCPQLRTLGLYLDAYHSPTLALHDIAKLTPHFRTLNVGALKIESAEHALPFLEAVVSLRSGRKIVWAEEVGKVSDWVAVDRALFHNDR